MNLLHKELSRVADLYVLSITAYIIEVIFCYWRSITIVDGPLGWNRAVVWWTFLASWTKSLPNFYRSDNNQSSPKTAKVWWQPINSGFSLLFCGFFWRFTVTDGITDDLLSHCFISYSAARIFSLFSCKSLEICNFFQTFWTNQFINLLLGIVEALFLFFDLSIDLGQFILNL